MSWRMPGADESASSMTTASFGSVSPMACSNASGCTGVALGGDRLRRSREPLARRAACAAGQAFAHGGRDVRQRGFRIAEDGNRRRIVLAELPGIDVEMDQLDRGRHRIDV